jgi:endogenous inhibitor of DNA gyrase (YacG/DUF329 family)
LKSSRFDHIEGMTSAPVSPKPSASRPCPICSKPSVAAHRPFCSLRCAQVDLGRWLKGGYAIPTDERPEEPDEG